MNKELYVSTTPHETKVALVEDDQLAEVYFERENEYTLAGSIYKGRVTRVLPGMQSAFVDIGLERDAFLYVSDFLELQDEEEDGEFGEVKVDGTALAEANGLIVPQTQAEEEEGAAEGPEAASGEDDGEEGRESGARRWRGRRRRRGRRGGRERVNGEASADASAGVAEAEPEVEASEVEESPRSRRRKPRGFEPRGLVEHGLTRGEKESDERAEGEVAALPEAHEPMLLPGESISKYSRGEGEAQTEAAPAETAPANGDGERSTGRRGGRGRRSSRGSGKDRTPRRAETTPAESEPQESAAAESTSEDNYAPIVLPGESISKYQDTEPAAQSLIEDAAAGEAGVDEEAQDAEAVAEEPRSSASYSGASRPPSLTQRHAPEEEAEELSGEEPSGEEVEVEAAAQSPDEAGTEEEIAEEVAGAEEEEPEEHPAGTEEEPEEHPAERTSWRGRVAKLFSSATEEEDAAGQTESAESESEEIEATATEVEQSEDAPRRYQGEPGEGEPGSFVIEGGHVEHEELDEEEAEMPALAEHFDRYEDGGEEENGEDESNGSQFGTAVRESGEENELEIEEYDFGDEEFEESELVAGQAVEFAGEEAEEEADEPLFASTPEAGRRSPQRFGRGERRGRRGAPQRGGRMRARQQSRALPLISELLKEGQEILVQIAKEPIGKKGARITSHIALPGRFLVYMPTVNHIGVSRKISSDEERHRLKRIVSSERENGHGGFIVRTAAANIREDELRADIRFLKHLWNEIRTRADGSKSPALIYHDLNLVERILRDQVTSDFSQIWVDNEGEYERVVRFASRFQAGLVRRIKLYTKDAPLFEQFGISDEINKSLKSKVWLKSGGYIVINQTEALVAIDINTGKYVGKTARLEDTIVKTNIDAVKEIVRQVRLRDLGGIIIIDFIDMDERKNRQKVMAALEEAMKADRAPSKILQFNDFGLVAITRKRVKQSLERTLGTPCPYCDATGFVKSVPTVCNEIYLEMRKIRRHVQTKEVVLRVNPEVAKELKSHNGRWLQEMEELVRHPVLVKNDPQLHQEKFDMNY